MRKDRDSFNIPILELGKFSFSPPGPMGAVIPEDEVIMRMKVEEEETQRRQQRLYEGEFIELGRIEFMQEPQQEMEYKSEEKREEKKEEKREENRIAFNHEIISNTIDEEIEIDPVQLRKIKAAMLRNKKVPYPIRDRKVVKRTRKQKQNGRNAEKVGFEVEEDVIIEGLEQLKYEILQNQYEVEEIDQMTNEQRYRMNGDEVTPQNHTSVDWTMEEGVMMFETGPDEIAFQTIDEKDSKYEVTDVFGVGGKQEENLFQMFVVTETDVWDGPGEYTELSYMHKDEAQSQLRQVEWDHVEKTEVPEAQFEWNDFIVAEIQEEKLEPSLVYAEAIEEPIEEPIEIVRESERKVKVTKLQEPMKAPWLTIPSMRKDT